MGRKATGDCFIVHGRFMTNPINVKDSGKFILVHAEVSGQGPLTGLRYCHCWLEKDGVVYDWTNGREIQMPKELYYFLGEVVQIEGKYAKYTNLEVCKQVLTHNHWGPWELTCEI